jgi:hypothetical protein
MAGSICKIVGRPSLSSTGATMSSPAISELRSFREYLDQRIAGGEVELTPENALRDWREMQESLQSIRRGIADADAGRIRTAESLLDELQARLVRR